MHTNDLIKHRAKGARTVAILALGLALIAAILIRPPVASAQASDPSQVRFGNEIASLLNANAIDELVARSSLSEVTCPLETPGGLIALCEGQPDGTQVSGYWTGTLGSDAAPVDEAALRSTIAYVRDEFFSSPDIRLYSVADSGRVEGSVPCPDCFAVVLSTESEAGIQPRPYVAILDVLQTSEGPKIHFVAIGGGSRAMVDGGTVGSQTFVRVLEATPTPGAPGTGSGTATADSAIPTQLAAAGLVLVALPGLWLASRYVRR